MSRKLWRCCLDRRRNFDPCNDSGPGLSHAPLGFKKNGRISASKGDNRRWISLPLRPTPRLDIPPSDAERAEGILVAGRLARDVLGIGRFHDSFYISPGSHREKVWLSPEISKWPLQTDLLPQSRLCNVLGIGTYSGCMSIAGTILELACSKSTKHCMQREDSVADVATVSSSPLPFSSKKACRGQARALIAALRQCRLLLTAGSSVEAVI
jgi:hypothetical protein